jgi:hypothetical protein
MNWCREKSWIFRGTNTSELWNLSLNRARRELSSAVLRSNYSIKENDSNKPLFPTTKIHAIAAVEQALKEKA